MTLSGDEINYLTNINDINNLTYGFTQYHSKLIKKIYRKEINDFLKIEINEDKNIFEELLKDYASKLIISRENDKYNLILKSEDGQQFEKIRISTDFFKLLLTIV